VAHTRHVYVDNTNLIEIDGLQSAADGTFVNDADVEATVFDSSGVAVAGQTWPTLLTYVPASSGVYQGVLSHLLELIAGAEYTLVIDAVDSANVGHWEYVFIAQTRRGS